MPLIRISDEAYHEIKELMNDGLTTRLNKYGYGANTISRTASALIRQQIKTERISASMTASKL